MTAFADDPGREDHAVSVHLGSYMLAGLLTCGLLLGGIAAWAATTELTGASSRRAAWSSRSNVTKVQHPTGGFVATLHVRADDGVTTDRCSSARRHRDKSQPADRFQAARPVGNARSRLRAERDGAVAISVPSSLANRVDTPDVQRIVSGEKLLFSHGGNPSASRSNNCASAWAVREEVVGINSQIQAQGEEIGSDQKGTREPHDIGGRATRHDEPHQRQSPGGRAPEGGRDQLIAAVAKARG